MEHPSVLLILFILCCPFISIDAVDICASPSSTPHDVHSGVVVSLSTGVAENVVTNDVPGKGKIKSCELDLPLDKSHGERTEISFQKPPVKDGDTCVNIEFVEDGKTTTKSVDCKTDPARKVFLTKDGVSRVTMKIYNDYIDSNLLNFELFVQNRKALESVENKYVTNGVNFDCLHDNNYILPNLFKDSIDLSSHLNVRNFNAPFPDAADPPQNLSGQYECSWESVTDGVPTPRSVYNVNVFADEIICDVLEKDEESGEFKTTGNDSNHLEMVIVEGNSLSNYKMSCSLKFYGGESESVVLNWDWAPPVDQESVDPNWGAATTEGGLKTNDFTHDLQLNTSVTYTCSASIVNTSSFDGVPKACTIKLATKEFIAREIEKTGGLWWVGLLLALVVIAVVFVVGAILHRNGVFEKYLRKSGKSDGVPAVEDPPQSLGDADDPSMGTGHEYDNTVVDMENNEDKIPLEDTGRDNGNGDIGDAADLDTSLNTEVQDPPADVAETIVKTEDDNAGTDNPAADISRSNSNASTAGTNSVSADPEGKPKKKRIDISRKKRKSQTDL